MRNWEEWGQGNCNQNIVYEKIMYFQFFFLKKLKASKKANTSQMNPSNSAPCLSILSLPNFLKLIATDSEERVTTLMWKMISVLE